MILWKAYMLEPPSSIITFTNEQASWTDLPSEGMAITACLDPPDNIVSGRWWVHGYDYYILMPGDTYPIGFNDLVPMLWQFGCEVPREWRPEQVREIIAGTELEPLVKFAATLSRETWSRFVAYAHNDPEAPPGITPNRRLSDRL